MVFSPVPCHEVLKIKLLWKQYPLSISPNSLGPRKKILNYINLVQSGADTQSTTELQLALIGEQQTVRSLREKLKQERDKETGNQQMIQSLFMSYQGIREKKDRILTSLTNALYVIDHIRKSVAPHFLSINWRPIRSIDVYSLWL